VTVTDVLSVLNDTVGPDFQLTAANANHAVKTRITSVPTTRRAVRRMVLFLHFLLPQKCAAAEPIAAGAGPRITPFRRRRASVCARRHGHDTRRCKLSSARQSALWTAS